MALTRYVVNRQLAALAGLSEATFRARAARVRALRSRNPVELNLWISTPERLHFLTRVHTAVHTGTFDARLTELGLSLSQVPVVLALPAPLWHWLRAHSLDQVHALVTNWMAALYAANHGRHDLLPAWKSTIKELATSRYASFDPGKVDALTPTWAAQFAREQQRLTHGPPADVLTNPFTLPDGPSLREPALGGHFCFSLRVGYFSEEDWLTVVVRDLVKLKQRFPSKSEAQLTALLQQAETDELRRAESCSDLWQGWKRTVAGG